MYVAFLSYAYQKGVNCLKRMKMLQELVSLVTEQQTNGHNLLVPLWLVYDLHPTENVDWETPLYRMQWRKVYTKEVTFMHGVQGGIKSSFFSVGWLVKRGFFFRSVSISLSRHVLPTIVVDFLIQSLVSAFIYYHTFLVHSIVICLPIQQEATILNLLINEDCYQKYALHIGYSRDFDTRESLYR